MTKDMQKALQELKGISIDVINYLSELIDDEDEDYLIVRNFLARGLLCVDSIYTLGCIGRAHDCSMLARSLVELLASTNYVYAKGKIEAYKCIVLEEEGKKPQHISTKTWDSRPHVRTASGRF